MNLQQVLLTTNFTKIYKTANSITTEVFGNDVYIRGIIEFSNYCRRGCIYCGINTLNDSMARYRMTEEEIIETAVTAWHAGYKTVVLQSGEDEYFTPALLGEIVKEIKNKTDLIITLSCGEFAYEDYLYLKNSGADRYLLKHETSDPEIFSLLHPDSSLYDRISCLKNIKKVGLDTGGGFMIGLPGQTAKTIADDIMLTKELRCDMAGIGPFIPHPKTPLYNAMQNGFQCTMHHAPCTSPGDSLTTLGSAELTRRVVALTRITIPHIHLPATTALGVLDRAERDMTFSCGANVIMKKVTPIKYRSMYEIYPIANKNYKNIYTERKEIEQLIVELGKNPV